MSPQYFKNYKIVLVLHVLEYILDLFLHLKCSFDADDILLQSWLWLNRDFNPYPSSVWTMWFHCT